MYHTDRTVVPELAKLDSACQTVLQMPELLELILTFLPSRKIFSIIRVSRYWKNVITHSFQLQYKMFLRLSDQPCELWTVDTKNKPGANKFDREWDHFNDTEITFRRIDAITDPKMPVVMPLAVNSAVRRCEKDRHNALHTYKGVVKNIWLGCNSWVNLLQRDASLLGQYLTDPGCRIAAVKRLELYLGNYNAKSGQWTPADVPEQWTQEDLPYDFEGETSDDPWKTNSFKIAISSQHDGGLDYARIESDNALTLGNLIEAAFTTHGFASCRKPKPIDDHRQKKKRARISKTFRRILWGPLNYHQRNKNVYETLEMLKKRLRAKEIPEMVFMCIFWEAWSPKGGHKMIVPTDEERIQASDTWRCSERASSEGHP